MKPLKLLDKVFSEYIRQRYADDKGEVKCVTCGYEDHWKYMQAGHYISRGYHNVRFDERNVHVQCPLCNETKEGNLVEYEKFMYKMYGSDIVIELSFLKRKEFKLMKHEITDMIKSYRQKIKELK